MDRDRESRSDVAYVGQSLHRRTSSIVTRHRCTTSISGGVQRKTVALTWMLCFDHQRTPQRIVLGSTSDRTIRPKSRTKIVQVIGSSDNREKIVGVSSGVAPGLPAIVSLAVQSSNSKCNYPPEKMLCTQVPLFESQARVVGIGRKQ